MRQILYKERAASQECHRTFDKESNELTRMGYGEQSRVNLLVMNRDKIVWIKAK
jgi:hypothetical protein